MLSRIFPKMRENQGEKMRETVTIPPENENKEIDLTAFAPEGEDHKLKQVSRAALLGVNLNKVNYFTPEFIKTAFPKDQWPVFHLKPKAGLNWQIDLLNRDIEALITSEGETESDKRAKVKELFEWTIFVLKKGLIGWTNFVDADGDPIPFELANGEPTASTLDGLTRDMSLAISEAIVLGLRLSKEEKTGLKL
jgi:hypothetical protein